MPLAISIDDVRRVQDRAVNQAIREGHRLSDHLLERLGLATGGRVAGILGMSPWEDQLTVWAKMTGRAPDEPDSVDMERGVFLEAGILKWYEHRTGRRVTPGKFELNKRWPWAAATPDGLTLCESPRAIEVKCPRRGDGWGEDGGDDVPKHYVIQSMWEMACADVEMVDVVGFIYGDLRIYNFPRNRAIEDALAERCTTFWLEYVKPDKAPPAGPRSEEFLSQRYANANVEMLSSTSEMDDLGVAYLTLKDRIDVMQEEAETLKNRLRQQIGEAAGISGEGWRVKWTPIDALVKPDWEQYARALGGSDEGAMEFERVTRAPYRRLDIREIRKRAA